MACALLSLNAIEPTLEDIGFKHSEAGQLREMCRQYLELWAADERASASSASTDGPPLDTEAWLDHVRKDHGQSLATRLAELSSRLANRPGAVARDGWTELMVRLPQEVERDSMPHLPAQKLQAFRTLADRHLEAMKRLDERVEYLGDASSGSEWDRALLESNFYPDDNDEDQAARRFDPKPWLWQLLSDGEWRTFAESLRHELTETEILELVSWGKAIPESTFGKYLAAPL